MLAPGPASARSAITETSADVTPDGSARQTAITLPGDRIIRRFAVTAGQRLYAAVTSPSAGTTLSILAPTGTSLVSETPSIAKPLFVDVEVGAAATTGLYSVVIDPASDATGTYAWSISAITEGSAPQAPDGVSRDATTTMPGERIYRTFAVTAGQRIYARVTSGDGSMALELRAPGGAVLDSATGNGSATALDVEIDTAAESGTYAVAVDPGGAATGTYALVISAITGSAVGVTADGSSRDATTTMPGERIYRTFPVSAGRRIWVRVTSSDKRMAV